MLTRITMDLDAEVLAQLDRLVDRDPAARNRADVFTRLIARETRRQATLDAASETLRAPSVFTHHFNYDPWTPGDEPERPDDQPTGSDHGESGAEVVDLASRARKRR